jgi:hypothetical protein
MIPILAYIELGEPLPARFTLAPPNVEEIVKYVLADTFLT